MFFSYPANFKERILFPGVTIRTAWGEKIMLSFVELQPGGTVPLHSHPHEQMGTVIEGEFELVIAGEARRVKKGDSYLVPSGVQHSARAFDTPALALDIFSPPREDYK